jgi:hypothetical protein
MRMFYVEPVYGQLMFKNSYTTPHEAYNTKKITIFAGIIIFYVLFSGHTYFLKYNIF